MSVDQHPLGVPRPLSDRDAPTPHTVERNVETQSADIVQRLDPTETIRPCRIGGQPPDNLAQYTDLLHALRDLLRGYNLSQRQVVLRDQSGALKRTTVGAVLRGERPARREVVTAIVRACGVDEIVVADWEAAWQRLGLPYLEERRQDWRDNACPNYYRATYGKRR